MLKHIGRSFLILTIFAMTSVLGGCVATTGGVSTSEALVLLDGTEIPCEILEFDSEYVYFEPALVQDRYNYGDFIARGEVQYIKVFRNNEVTVFKLNDYVEKNTVAIEDEVTAPEPVEQTRQADVLQSEFKRFAEQQETPVRQNEQAIGKTEAGPGLRLSQVRKDSLRQNRSSIGLQMPSELGAANAESLAEADYQAIGNLIIASGAAGLVMYRAEQFAERDVQLTDAPRQLVEQLKISEEWKKRAQGILAANRLANEDFNKKYPEVKDSVADQFNFRPQTGRADYTAFVLHLHINGGLRSPRQKQQFETLFGALATRAFADILANFDDWYYLVVIQSRK